MMEVVKLFQDQGSVDELGIGSIRDAFSDSFFPGTSVLHTRARYFFFIPWLLKDVARRGKSVQESRAALRSAEVSLIRALIAGGEQAGVIGSQAQEKLKTMPSQVYWPALGALGLRRWDVSIDGYFRRASGEARGHGEVTSLDAESSRVDLGLDDSIPAPPAGLFSETTFALTREEADTLRGFFLRLDKSALTPWLAAHADSAAGDWIWQHPQVGDLPDEHRDRVDHARRLHHVWHGAPLLYNLMLARLCDDDDRTGYYEDELDAWEAEVSDARALDGWSRDDFWILCRRLNPRLGNPTQRFVSGWIDLLEAGEHRGPKAEQLVRERELRLKGARSRITNPAARDGWSGGAGLARLGYRWRVAQRFLDDMFVGLQDGEVA
jgi:hypothetical protein